MDTTVDIWSGTAQFRLGSPVQKYYMIGLAMQHKLYACGMRRFIGICSAVGYVPMLADDAILLPLCVVGSSLSYLKGSTA